MKVSVIIPIYNAKKYLKCCLDSVIEQTFSDYELILINDGSTDGSEQICLEYAIKNERVIIVNKKNHGVSSARNTGITFSSGEYICFVDADDYVEKDMLSVLLKNAENEKADISSCGLVIHSLDGKQVSNKCDGCLQNCLPQDVEYSFFTDQTIKDVMYGPYNKIFRKTSFLGKRFDEKLSSGEDLLYVFDCIICSKKIVFENIGLYHYLKHENTLSTSSFSSKNIEYVRAAEQIVEKTEKSDERTRNVAIKWLFLQKMYLARSIYSNRARRNKYYNEYLACKYFCESHIKSVQSELSIKTKFDFISVFRFPSLGGLIENIRR